MRLEPKRAGVYSALAGMLSGQGRLAEVIAHRRTLVRLKPKSSMAASALLATLHYAEESTPEMMLAEAKAWAAVERTR